MRTSIYLSLAAAASIAVVALGVGTNAAPVKYEARKWVLSTSLNEPRAGSCAVALEDGRVLLSGGSNDGGVLASAEYVSAGGPSLATAPMSTGRSGHVCAALPGGKILVAGGQNSAGAAMSSAEIFDPSTGAWSLAGGMMATRAHASATPLLDGRVLVTGGEASGSPISSLEIFTPAEGNFSAVVGLLSSARKGHAAARLTDGRVIIAGGSNGEAALATIDIFDPATDGIAPFVEMSTPRDGLTATTLLDGRVLLAGGSNGERELATMEILDPGAGTTQPASAMETARRDHLAVRIPNNNTVLLIGGTLDGKALASSGRYIPWRDSYEPMAPMDVERAAAATAAVKGGVVLIAGGRAATNQATGNTLFAASPTIQTDKLDYPPGDWVTINGANWTPGNTVNLVVEIVPERTVTRWSGTATVGADGTLLLANAFQMQLSDAGVSFELTATEQGTGLTAAVWAFTDALSISASGVSVGTQSPASVATGSNATFPITVSLNGSGSTGCNLTLAVSGLPGGATGVFSPNPIPISGNPGSVSSTLTVTAGTASGSFTVNASTPNINGGAGCNASSVNGAGTLTLAASVSTTTAVTSSLNPSTYGDSVNFSATVTRSTGSGSPTGSIQFKIDGTNFGPPVTVSAATATTANANSGSTTTLTAGPHSITADYTPTGTFASSTGSLTQNVNQKSVTPSITAPDKTYDRTTSAIILTRTLSGVLPGDVANVTLTGGTATFADKNVGTGKTVTATGLSLTGSASGNYVLSSTSATTTADITTLTITGSFAANNKVYDANTAATIATRSLTGVIAPDVVSLTGGAATFDTKNVGTGKTVTATGFTLSGADAGNYVLGSSTLTTTADITAATLTVSFTANTKVYDGNNNATIATRSVAGVIAPDVVTVSGGTATFDNKNAGTGKTVTGSGFVLGGADGGNYVISPNSVTTTANITALTITGSFTANNKPYDGNTSATIATRSLTGVIAPDVVSLTGGAATFDTKNVGTGKTVTGMGFTLSGADAGNYLLASPTLTTTADITAATLTVSFTANTKVYDGNNNATIATRSVAGVIAPDVVTVSGGTATFDNKNVGTGKTVTGSGFVLGGADGGNYLISANSVTTTANITALTITGSFAANNKPYDGNTLATISTRSLTGVIAPDVVSLTGGAATFDTKNVGTGKTVTATGFTLSGADAGNYLLASPTLTTTADITAATLTVSFTANTKVYDGNATASILTRTLNGVIAPDVVTVSGGTATFDNKNVGTGKTVTGSGFVLGGADGGNYVISPNSVTTTANITALTITGSFTANNKPYDGNTLATIATRSLTGVIAPDAVSLAGSTATFDNKNVGTGKTVTGTGFTLSGADAGNYLLASPTLTTTADITAATLTVSFTANTKMYDGNATASILTRTLNGVIAPDVVTVSGGTATFDNKNVGTGKTVTGSGFVLGGADSGNYVISPNSAMTTASITALTITGSFTANNKPYDGNTSATIATRSLTGVIAPDAVSLAGSTATFDTKNVGTGKTVTGTGFTLSGADAGNYLLASPTLTTTADITAATLTVSFTANTKVYDANATASILTRTLNGVIAPDVMTVTGGTATFDSKNAGTGKTVTGSGFVLGGADSGNYVISPNSATTTANITALTITGSFTANNKPYDGNTSASIATRSLTGVIAPDAVSLAGSTATFDNKNVGTGKTVTGTGFTLSGADAGNYLLTSSTLTTTANVTARALTVSATGVNKTYDGTTAVTVILADNRVPGDVVTTSYTAANLVDPNVGIGKTVNVSGISISGIDAGNYTFNTTTTTTADISARPTTTTLTSGLDISVTPVRVNLTAAVTSIGSPLIPTGSVSFTDSVLGSLGLAVPLNASGIATLATTSLGVGQHVITATYIPTVNFVASPSAANNAPAATITGQPVGSIQPVGGSFTFTATFTDTLGNTPTATAAWSFDTSISVAGTVGGSPGNGTLTKSYAFSTAGVYQVSLTVNDNLGGITIANTVAPDNLPAMVVVYDPNGGFVTGGGWINSPEGAYLADLTSSGKAHFGFVSKYQKGANVPTGETEFQYQAGSLKFKSTSYDWLVVAGSKAQYKGVGTLDGAGVYGFMLTAIDGSIDKLRMKIWVKATNALVYDSGLGGADDIDTSPTTPLGGGSIVIHSK